MVWIIHSGRSRATCPHTSQEQKASDDQQPVDGMKSIETMFLGNCHRTTEARWETGKIWRKNLVKPTQKPSLRMWRTVRLDEQNTFGNNCWITESYICSQKANQASRRIYKILNSTRRTQTIRISLVIRKNVRDGSLTYWERKRASPNKFPVVRQWLVIWNHQFPKVV